MAGIQGVTSPADAGGKPIPATLADVSVEALTSPRYERGEPQPMEGKDHLHAFTLAQRIFQAVEPIEVSAEEIVVIKRRVAEHYLQPLVVGQVLLMLEGDDRN